MTTEGLTGVYARSYDTIDRAVQVGFASGRAIRVSFPETPPDDADTDHDLLDRIGSYLRGTEDDFADVEIGLTVATDRRRVLESVRRVPYGEEASVSQVTRMAGFDPDDADDLALVKEALRENPVPLVVGDHRVQGGPYATPRGVREAFRRAESV